MRKAILLTAAVCVLAPALAFAQAVPDPAANTPATTAPAPPASPGSSNYVLPAPSSTVGLNKTSRDGVSTVTVPAVPCSTSARETDGTTTCVGIPGPVRKSRTVGTAR